MRNPGPYSDCGFAPLRESSFDCRMNTRRDLKTPWQEADALGELRGGRGRTQRHWPGVGNGRRKCAEPDGNADVKLIAEAEKRIEEAMPAKVWLGAGQHEQVASGAIAPMTDLQSGPLEAHVHAIDETHRRTSRALVNELVGVEADEAMCADLRLQGTDRARPAVSGVDPPI